jgi:hypothetical protein
VAGPSASNGGKRWRSATKRKVAGSILDCANGFVHWQSFQPHCAPGVDSACFFSVSMPPVSAASGLPLPHLTLHVVYDGTTAEFFRDGRYKTNRVHLLCFEPSHVPRGRSTPSGLRGSTAVLNLMFFLSHSILANVHFCVLLKSE